MRRIDRLVSLVGLIAALAVVAPAAGQDERARVPIDAQEWSVWVGSPAQTAVNASRAYGNAMPEAVGTSRPKRDAGDETAARFPIAPASIVQFFGEPAADVDVELRVQKGALLSHWPPGKESGGRIRYFGSDFVAAAPADVPPGYLPEAHWMTGLRGSEAALFLRNESRVERFLAYDAELTLPIPIKIRGGPDEFTLQNTSAYPLRDVAVVVPTEAGFRVGWLDVLPTGVPAEEKPKEKTEDGAEEATDGEKAEAVFEEGQNEPKDDEKPAPLPAEADPTVRARVDQMLNRPIEVDVEKASVSDAIGMIAGQVRLRYELDDRTIAKAEIDPSRPTGLKAAGSVAARDALAEVLGNAGLSYRVTDSGGLFITTAARLAEAMKGQGVAIEGPPVTLGLSLPLKADDPSYRQLTIDTHARRLAGQGLREELAKALLDQYGAALFRPGELIVLAHLSREAIDEVVLLDVFPPPRTLDRVALLVVHGVDPRLQDRARGLVEQLGDPSPKTRDAAEARLLELGPAVVPALEDALIGKDVEIVFRAERILMRLNRPVP